MSATMIPPRVASVCWQDPSQQLRPTVLFKDSEVAKEKPRVTRASQHKAENQRLRQNSKGASSLKPLAPTDGNRRTSSRAKPLTAKERHNVAQQQADITILDKGTVEVMDTSGTDDAAIAVWLTMRQYLDDRLSRLEQQNEEIKQQNMEIKKQNAEIILQNNELKQDLTQYRQQVEELEIRVHQVQERNSIGLGASIPSTAAMSEKNVLTPPKADELYCTIDFSRASEGEEIMGSGSSFYETSS